MASTSCTTLDGVSLTAGSTTLATSAGQLRKAYKGAPVYGTGIPSTTTIVTVTTSSSATLSNAATVTEIDATLTVCPRGAGSITCSVTGLWKFSPGLLIKARVIKETEDLTFTDCVTSPSNEGDASAIVPHLLDYDPWTSTTPGISLSCADFEGTTFTNSTVATVGKVNWNVPPSKPSSFDFGGFTISAPTGEEMITFPNPGGTVSVKGAYAGSYAAINLIANPNAAFKDKCTSIAGVESVAIATGTVTFGQPSS